MKKFLKFILKVSIPFIVGFVIIFLCILNGAVNSKPQKSDAIIVLGCQIWDKSPSWTLEYRLKEALKLYQQGYVSHIIVSGGQGADEKASEASVMKQWLINKGINESVVYEEDKSTSTFENLKFSKKIMDQYHFKSAIIVSSDFHLFRALTIARRLDIKASGASSPSVAHLKPYYYSREVISVIKSFIFDR